MFMTLCVSLLQLFPNQLEKSLTHVILHVQSAEINQHLSVPVSRSNGFLFIQTDKPLYTPHQSGESLTGADSPDPVVLVQLVFISSDLVKFIKSAASLVVFFGSCVFFNLQSK